jgi:hypothetical protein
MGSITPHNFKKKDKNLLTNAEKFAIIKTLQRETPKNQKIKKFEKSEKNT